MELKIEGHNVAPHAEFPKNSDVFDNSTAKPDLGRTGTRRENDGTLKDPEDQLKGIMGAQEKNREAIQSVQKSLDIADQANNGIK